MRRRSQVVTLLCVGLVCLAAVPNAAAEADDQVAHGFVYLAQLMVLHPLYSHLARLEGAISALRAPEVPVELPVVALGGRVYGQYIAGPVVLHWPGDAWSRRRGIAQQELTTPIVRQAQALPPDLVARLDWERSRAQEATRQALLEAEARDSRELAEATARLYRENQERLQNLDDAATAAADAPTRQSVEGEIEAELARRRDAQQRRVAELRSELLKSQETRTRAAEHDVWREADLRLRPASAQIGRTLRADMLQQMTRMTTPAWLSTVQVRLAAPRLPTAGSLPDDWDTSVRAAREDARRRRLDELVRQRSRAAQIILDATALAAERVARGQCIAIRVVPRDDPAGPDLTDSIADGLRDLWSVAGESRSQEE